MADASVNHGALTFKRRLIWCLALSGMVIGASAVLQQPWTYNDGLGWDGAQYARLAAQCGREPMSASEPFAYRIGVPCLASLLPMPPKHALWSINVAASVLLLVLLDVWLRRHLEAWIARWLLAAFALHWLTPLRHVWWYPTYIDPLAMCAMLAALLLVDRMVVFAAVCFGGALIRETMMIVPAGVVGASMFGAAGPLQPWWGRVRGDHRFRAGIAGVAACAVAAMITRAVVTPTTDYWMLDSALHWAYEKPLPRYVLALFITFGPALVLLAVRPGTVREYLVTHRDHAVILFVVLLLAWVGGTDTERFLLWGAPIVLVAIGRAAQQIDWRQARGALVLLLVGQAINGRWFVPTPDHVLNEVPRHWPLLTPIGATRSALLFSETPDLMMSAVALAQYLVLAAILFLWLEARTRERRTTSEKLKNEMTN